MWRPLGLLILGAVRSRLRILWGQRRTLQCILVVSSVFVRSRSPRIGILGLAMAR